MGDGRVKLRDKPTREGRLIYDAMNPRSAWQENYVTANCILSLSFCHWRWQWLISILRRSIARVPNDHHDQASNVPIDAKTCGKPVFR